MEEWDLDSAPGHSHLCWWDVEGITMESGSWSESSLPYSLPLAACHASVTLHNVDALTLRLWPENGFVFKPEKKFLLCGVLSAISTVSALSLYLCQNSCVLSKSKILYYSVYLRIKFLKINPSVRGAGANASGYWMRAESGLGFHCRRRPKNKPPKKVDKLKCHYLKEGIMLNSRRFVNY